MKKTALFILCAFCIINLNAQKSITILYNTNIDTLKSIMGGNKLWEKTTNLLHNEGVEHIRIHDYHGAGDYCDYTSFWNKNAIGNYLSINTGFNPNIPSNYDWTATDSIVNQIITKNFEVFFRIGVSYPNAAIPPIQPYSPPYNSVNDRMNFSKFASLSKHTVMHYNHSWDNGFNYPIKYWEIWNEPGGLFWDSTVVQFYKMYKQVSDSIKNYDPSVKVGALGAVATTTIGVNTDYREGFIQYCANNNLNLDFYSWHIYGVKNPYGIKEFADTVRTLLDVNGFTHAESIVSEINLALATGLDTVKDSPWGAAYYLSTAFTLFEGKVDRLLWYPSGCHVMNFNGDTLSSRSFYAFSSLKKMQNETPIKLKCIGDEVVDGNFNVDTTNLMIVAGKSIYDDKMYFMISNLKSNNSNFAIHLKNLPWTPTDSLRVDRYEITANHRYLKTTTFMAGSNNLNIVASNFSSPSILFYTIEEFTGTGISQQEKSKIKIENPVNQMMRFTDVPQDIKTIEIYDISGKKVMECDFETIINVGSLATGTYIIVLRDNDDKDIIARKFQKL